MKNILCGVNEITVSYVHGVLHGHLDLFYL